MMKACRKCSEVKPMSSFSKDSKGAGGVRSRCKECDCAAVMARMARDVEGANERQRNWKLANRAAVLKGKADYRAKNPDYDTNYYKENRARKIANALRWKKANRERATANQAARRSSIRNQMPPWADRAAILSVYSEAARLRAQGHDVQVDHIFPLRGATVSGLHIAENLQIIPSRLNSSKGNRWWPGLNQQAGV